MRLANKVAIVTGAASGFGKAIAETFAREGAKVVVADINGQGARDVAQDLGRRLISIFLPGADGRRPVYGGTATFQEDPHWRDLVLFYEYFHGDEGAGLGASHQTGWTGLVAALIQLFGHLDPESVLSLEDRPLARAYRRVTGEPMARVETAREARGVHPGDL